MKPLHCSSNATIFCNPEPEAVRLVDATNIFNSLNRQAIVYNISIFYPLLAQVLINTYTAPIGLLIPGNGEALLTEGTIQGDLYNCNGRVCYGNGSN